MNIARGISEWNFTRVYFKKIWHACGMNKKGAFLLI